MVAVKIGVTAPIRIGRRGANNKTGKLIICTMPLVRLTVSLGTGLPFHRIFIGSTNARRVIMLVRQFDAAAKMQQFIEWSSE
ncbi:MAG: hypothetical protein R3E44_02460 [Paracoccaceae bacterium]